MWAFRNGLILQARVTLQYNTVVIGFYSFAADKTSYICLKNIINLFGIAEKSEAS